MSKYIPGLINVNKDRLISNRGLKLRILSLLHYYYFFTNNTHPQKITESLSYLFAGFLEMKQNLKSFESLKKMVVFSFLF